MVLHIDTGREWRGGQQQAFYLHQGLVARNIRSIMACPAGSEMLGRCREAGLAVTTLNCWGELDVLAGLKAGRICRRESLSVIHCHTAHALAIGLWARWLNKKLKVIGVRRVDFHLKKNMFSRYKYTGRGVSRIVCISQAIRNVLLSDGLDPDRLVTIHSGVDTQKYVNDTPPPEFRSGLGVPDEYLLVGCVAALVGHKDYPTLLKAAARVIRQNGHITFCAFGDGSLKSRLHDLHRELGLGPRFIFAGFRKDVGYFLNSMDIFVLSSRLEGLGTSLLDAQGVGLPVAATRAGGIPEVVTDGENGLLSEPGDAGGLADNILRLAEDKELRTRLGACGKQTVREFAITRTIDKNIDLYNQIT